jgi:hypothetical protein
MSNRDHARKYKHPTKEPSLACSSKSVEHRLQPVCAVQPRCTVHVRLAQMPFIAALASAARLFYALAARVG